MYLLVTGGAGYIGSHTVVELLAEDYHVLVLDNLANSSAEVFNRIEQISGQKITFIEGDIRDVELLDRIFSQYEIKSVLHFAGLKAVAESVRDPLSYYDTNVAGSICLLQAMERANVRSIVFSSSATIYGTPSVVPISESATISQQANPYGKSKYMIEQVLQDLYASDHQWRVAVLRYFNPVGAHKSGLIGEDPNDIPNNLMPIIARVATGRLDKLFVYGNDYPTTDGTGVRDYIHVEDLARGHIDALKYVDKHGGLHIWNLGSGNGYSVLDMVRAFEHVSAKKIPYDIVERRQGDIPECMANPEKANIELGWSVHNDLEDIMQDTWRWIQKNPHGYES